MEVLLMPPKFKIIKIITQLYIGLVSKMMPGVRLGILATCKGDRIA